MFDAQQRDEERVAACLRDDPRAGIDEVGRRAAGNHIAGVLFVSRRVGDDELAFVRREIAVGHVDGNALFAFGLQSVEQQCVVDVVAGVAHALAVAFEGVELVFIDFLAVKQQPPDEGRFAVVHRTGGQETKQVFLLVVSEKLFN